VEKSKNLVILLFVAFLLLFAWYLYKKEPHISIVTHEVLRVDTLVIRDTVRLYTTILQRDTVIKEVRVLEFRDSLIEATVYVPVDSPDKQPKLTYRFISPLITTTSVLTVKYELKKDWRVGLALGANVHGGLIFIQGGYKEFGVGYDFLQKTVLFNWEYRW
jgi:hypothetical protein